MRSSVPAILCVMGLLFGLNARASADDYDLVVITPHNVHIQQEFEHAFGKHVGKPLSVRWIKQGTGQLIQLLDAKERAASGGSLGFDVFFGGGVPDHDLAAAKGYLEPPNLPDEILGAIPSEIAGLPNYDEKRLWVSTAISSFGILVNQRGLRNQGLDDVTSWKDLADPKMFSWVILVDPRKSASVQVSYEAVLQQYGWAEGWVVLSQMAANSRLIADSSSAVPNEVATGDVLAGPCIDFYASARIAQVGKDILHYVHPTGGTAVTPDPISMLRHPPHRKMAERFIAFVLSPAGQRVYSLPAGVPGGPQEHALFRLPVRSDMYSTDREARHVANPYEMAAEGKFLILDGNLQRTRVVVLAELMGAGLVDLHDELRSTWKALIDGGMKPDALALWKKPLLDESEVLALAKQFDDGGRTARKQTRRWIRRFQEKYEQVKALAR
ncbi:MAG: ABC transporter substrate-binding protein [Phycisphaerae bacterium]|jgi:ABC-type Fe3+ transport system substrate-binding protein